jgi:hypothetical protein
MDIIKNQIGELPDVTEKVIAEIASQDIPIGEVITGDLESQLMNIYEAA